MARLPVANSLQSLAGSSWLCTVHQARVDILDLANHITLLLAPLKTPYPPLRKSRSTEPFMQPPNALRKPMQLDWDAETRTHDDSQTHIRQRVEALAHVMPQGKGHLEGMVIASRGGKSNIEPHLPSSQLPPLLRLHAVHNNPRPPKLSFPGLPLHHIGHPINPTGS